MSLIESNADLYTINILSNVFGVAKNEYGQNHKIQNPIWRLEIQYFVFLI